MCLLSFSSLLTATCHCLSSSVLSTPSTHTGRKSLEAKAPHRVSVTRPGVHLSLGEPFLGWVPAMCQALLLVLGIRR